MKAKTFQFGVFITSVSLSFVIDEKFQDDKTVPSALFTIVSIGPLYNQDNSKSKQNEYESRSVLTSSHVLKK